MQTKLVFCDLDDTYLRSDKTIGEVSQRLVGELAFQGIGLIPCTGRMFSGLPQFFLRGSAVRFAVCCMGATIVEFCSDGPHNVFEGGISQSSVLRLYDVLKDMDIVFDVFANGHSYAERWRLDRIRGFPIALGMMQFVLQQRVPIDQDIPTFIADIDRIERLNVYYKTESDGGVIRSAIDDMNELSYTNHDGCGLEVVNSHISKGTALRWLCQHVGIDTCDTLAFGDGENDIPMLVSAGVGVAMANACEACKSSVSRVTKFDNDHDGVARYLYHVLGAYE